MGTALLLFGFLLFCQWLRWHYAHTVAKEARRLAQLQREIDQREAERDAAVFEAVEALRGALRVQREQAYRALGLAGAPENIEDLKSARRKAMMTAHPDLGGSMEMVVEVDNAYQRVFLTMAPEDSLDKRDKK